MPDPFLPSARNILRSCQADMRAAIEGLPAEALNWRPAGPDSNTVAALVSHSLSSTRWWLSVAVAEPLPKRDRPSEFKVSAADTDELLRTLDDSFEACLALPSNDRSVDWSATFPHWDPAENTTLPAAWALLHALEHLREHVGHVTLTRQLWERRPAP